jgi:hypothetical protein
MLTHISFSDIKKCSESYGTPKPERRMGRSLLKGPGIIMDHLSEWL